MFPYGFMPITLKKRQVRFDNAQIAIQGSKAQVEHDRNCLLPTVVIKWDPDWGV